MKNLLLLLSLISCALTINAQIIFYEGFPYNVGDTLPQPDWTGVNTGDQIFITTGSLTYSGFAASTGEKVSFDGSGRDYQRTFSSISTGTVYLSFIINITNVDLDTVGGYFTGFGSSTTTFGSTVWTKKSGSGFNIGFNPRTTVANTLWDNTVYALNEPVLIVVSYELVSGTTNDVSKIWINPGSTSFGANEPTPLYNVINTGTDMTSINRMFIRQDNPTKTPFIDMDEIRVGSSWASVTPTATGINAISFENEITIYPNPVKNTLNIKSNEPLKQIIIYDLTGKSLKTKENYNENNLTINISDLSKGIYFIQTISTTGKTFTTKFIK